jgi:hypothetical protein
VITMSFSSEITEPGEAGGAVEQPRREANGPNSLHHSMVVKCGGGR